MSHDLALVLDVIGLICSFSFCSLASTKLIPCSAVIVQTSFSYWNLGHILEVDSCAPWQFMHFGASAVHWILVCCVELQ